MGDRSDGYVFWCVAAAAAVLGFHIFSFWFLNFLLSISIAWSPGIVSSGWWPLLAGGRVAMTQTAGRDEDG
jgi:hypothetical protein